MARAVMTPLTPAERMRPTAPDGRSLRKIGCGHYQAERPADFVERLEISNRQYWFRVLSAFAEDFPGLRAVLGERKFDAAAKAYINDCPSTSFTLRNRGSKLEAWLRKNPKWNGTARELAVDMVRLRMG